MIKKLKNKETIKYIGLGLILLVIFFLPKEASAGFWSVFGDATIGTIFSSLGLIFVGLMAGILKIAGDIFDLAIGMTLLNPEVNNIEAIKIGWRIIRDISNLFLIFALVFIAIATILQIESYGAKKLILPLLLVALLINFSLAVTKFVIDISNILALQFYYAVDVQTSGPGTADGSNTEYKSLSSVFMAGTQLQSVYEYDFKDPVAEDRTSGSEFSAEVKPTEEITNWKIGKAQWLGGILFAIAAFVLFAGAILFIIRQVSLLILMVLSPLAFVFGIFPGTKKHGQEWWNALFSQAFFAPAYLFMFYLTAKIAQESKFLDLIGVGTKYGQKAASLGNYLAGQGATKASPEGGYLLNFLIMAVLMIGALWVAKKMGAVGADMTWKWGGKINKSLSGYAGRLATRHSVGRAGEFVAESKAMKKFAARSPAIGGWFARQAKKVSKTGGLDKVREEQIALGMSMAPGRRAEYISKAHAEVKKGMLDKMPDREIAEMLDRAPAETKNFINELISRLPEAKKEKVYEALGKRDLERDKDELIKVFFGRNATTQGAILSEIKKERLPALIQAMNDTQKQNFVQIAKDTKKALDSKIFKADPTMAALSGTDDEKIEAMAQEIKKGIYIEDIDEKLAGKDLFMQAMVRGLQSGGIEKLKDRGGPLYEKYALFLKTLANGSDKRADVVAALETADNKSAARYFASRLMPEEFGLAKEPAAAAAPGATGTTTPPSGPTIIVPNVIGGRGGQRYSPPQTPTAGGRQTTIPPSSGQQSSGTTPTTPPAGPGRSSRGGTGRTASGGLPGRP